MMTQATVGKVFEMKLFGMAQAFQSQLENPQSGQLRFEERFGLLVDQEHTYRDNRSLQRLLKEAKLREAACIEDIDYLAERGLDRAGIASLALCIWIQQRHNLIVTRPTGSGKTWMACALGTQACRLGMSVSFQRLPLLLEDLAVSHGDGSFRKRMAHLAKFDLLVLDDFRLAALNAIGRNDMLEIIESRAGAKATLITSQLPVDRWHDYLSGGNLTLADAILDRLVGGSQRLEIRGESMRKKRKAAG